MSFYSDYLQETGFRQIVEMEQGFITYFISGSECYIVDLFVSKEFRGTFNPKYLMDTVANKAKEAFCSKLLTSVNLLIPEPQRSKNIALALAYGFFFSNADSSCLWFVKEI